MCSYTFNIRSFISSLLIFVILLQIGGCSSNYVRTYSGNNMKVFDEESEVDSISVIYTDDQKIAIDEYYWRKDKIYFNESSGIQQKQSLEIYDIDSVTFSDQRTMVLVANNMYIIDSLFLKNGSAVEPLDFEWIGEQLAYRTLQTYPFRTIITLQDIDSISAVYHNPGRLTSPGVVLLALGVITLIYTIYFLCYVAFSGMR